MGDDVGDTKDQANGKLAASSCDSVSEKVGAAVEITGVIFASNN
jgi:hypothetical protein